MPKRKEPPPTQEEQSERFRSQVERLIAAGELNPTEADERFEKLAGSLRLPK
jgi:hypothetical protein